MMKGSNGPGGNAILPVTGAFFLVEVSGLTIGEFASCTGLRIEVETIEYSEGGNNTFVHTFPTRRRNPPIELSRGLTDQSVLLEWFSAVYDQNYPPADITISLMHQQGTSHTKWAAVSAYPIQWSGPELAAGSNQIAMESLTIVHQGLQVL
jgi:phage tail-like protein